MALYAGKQPREKMMKRGDVARVTTNIKALIETQWVPEEIAQEIAWKEFMVICSYKDKSYDLEWTKVLLDNSVLEYMGHPKRVKWGKRRIIAVDQANGEYQTATVRGYVKDGVVHVENVRMENNS